MAWQTIVALVIMVPVLLIPVALIWYINVGGMYIAIKEARARKAAKKETVDQLSTQPTKR